jgi:hypothetical protein
MKSLDGARGRRRPLLSPPFAPIDSRKGANSAQETGSNKDCERYVTQRAKGTTTSAVESSRE